MRTFCLVCTVLFFLESGAYLVKYDLSNEIRSKKITFLLTALVNLGLGIWGLKVLF